MDRIPVVTIDNDYYKLTTKFPINFITYTPHRSCKIKVKTEKHCFGWSYICSKYHVYLWYKGSGATWESLPGGPRGQKGWEDPGE